jgi:para-nitrobenzyl esterase
MAYVFGEGYPGNEIVPPVQPLVEIVQAYWINFAYTGDPNGEGSETWPAYETASDQHIVLKEPASVGSALQQQACDYWASYNEN